MKRLFILLFTVSAVNAVFAQSVGIGTTTPNNSAQLDITSPFNNKGILIPRMTTAQRNAIPSPAPGLIVYDTDFNDFFYMNTAFSGWIRLINSTFWNRSATHNWLYNSLDSVAIFTSTPKERLHVEGGNIYLRDNRTAANNPFMIYEVPISVDGKQAGIQFKDGADTLASISYINNPSIRNYIKLSVSNAEVGSSDLTVNTLGYTGIGTSDPQTKLHIRNAGSTSDETIRLEAGNPMIKFRKYVNAFTYDDIGFIQTADNDLRVGTFSTNTGGDFIIRTGGTDNVQVSDNGNVAIGQNVSPLAKLQITGGDDAGLSTSTNGYAMMGVATGTSSNLLIDNNEIMVRSGYNTAGSLFLQNNGGELVSGARLTINKGAEALKLNGSNPNIGFYQSGVYKSFIEQTGNDLFLGANGGNIRIDAVGQVAIGNVVPAASAFKLSVTGKIICEEVKVKLSAAWPDYVFDEKHQLLPIDKLSDFIRVNKHLPNIPAASEIEKNGIELGDMQKKIMEKTEELTLYIIQLEKRIKQLESSQTRSN